MSFAKNISSWGENNKLKHRNKKRIKIHITEKSEINQLVRSNTQERKYTTAVYLYNRMTKSISQQAVVIIAINIPVTQLCVTKERWLGNLSGGWACKYARRAPEIGSLLAWVSRVCLWCINFHKNLWFVCGSGNPVPAICNHQCH